MNINNTIKALAFLSTCSHFRVEDAGSFAAYICYGYRFVEEDAKAFIKAIYSPKLLSAMDSAFSECFFYKDNLSGEPVKKDEAYIWLFEDSNTGKQLAIGLASAIKGVLEQWLQETGADDDAEVVQNDLSDIEEIVLIEKGGSGRLKLSILTKFGEWSYVLGPMPNHTADDPLTKAIEAEQGRPQGAWSSCTISYAVSDFTRNQLLAEL